MIFLEIIMFNRIKQLKLTNFKIHSELDLNFNNNCLIYGENGSGKSSIYWGLYSIFKVYFRNQNFDFQKFKKINADELTIDVKFDSSFLSIPASSYELPSNIKIENFNTIYFANQELLESIIIDNNFYESLKNKFSKYFISIENLTDEYNNLEENLNSSNVEEITSKRIKLDEDFNIKLNEIFGKANMILEESFKEKFKITFTFTNSSFDENLKFKKPSIILKLKDNSTENIANNIFFNEGKLKLVSLSIFFTLIKLEENSSNKIKLLVLDDFLSSLDMANRSFIIAYILKVFEDYQKIILTHNIHFYNLVKDKINQDKIKEWDFKNIYLRKDNNSIVYDERNDYLTQASSQLDENNLSEAANLIRKEFEKIIHEIEKKFQIGEKEDTNNVVEIILNNKWNFYESNLQLKNIKHCQNLLKRPGITIDEISKELSQIQIEKKKFSHLNQLLGGILFYRKIVLNKGSHYLKNDELFKKELEDSLTCIKLLGKKIGIYKN